MKKIASMILLIAVLFPVFSSVSSAAAVVPRLYLNGSPMDSAGPPPAIVNGSTYVPIRMVAEGMGYSVNWDNATKTVSVYDGRTAIAFIVGANTAFINGERQALTAPAKIFNDKTYNNVTMIPQRFLAESMGKDVYYDSATKSVYISEPAESGEPAGTPDPAAGEERDPAAEAAVPSDAMALVRSVDVGQDGTTTIQFDGSAESVKPEKLSSPARLVLDLPLAAFDPGFEGYRGASTAGERAAPDGSVLSKVRFSYYSDKPSTVRFVWDLANEATYTYEQTDGMIQLKITGSAKPAAPVPAPPSGGKIYKIVLDAGHGAHDPGAIGITGYREKDFNLAVTQKVEALLKKDGRFKVYMTRSDDTFVALNDRASFANNQKADLFLSFHANALVGSAATGTETFYSRADSKRLADTVHKHLLKATGLKDRGVKTAGYVVIKKTTMPAILLESGFLTNAKDEALLRNEAKQNEIAAAVVAGIKEYLKLK